MKIAARIALEAKALVLLAFRNGPIENIHAGSKNCPTYKGNPAYSRISDPEMRQIMKTAVDRIATLLMLREGSEYAQYEKLVVSALDYVTRWDEPQIVAGYLRKKPRAGKRTRLTEPKIGKQGIATKSQRGDSR